MRLLPCDLHQRASWLGWYRINPQPCAMQRQSTQNTVVLTPLVWPHSPPREFCRRLHLLLPQLPEQGQPSPPRLRIGDEARTTIDSTAAEPAGPGGDAAENDAAAPLLADDAAAVEPAGPPLAANSGLVPVMPGAVDGPPLLILSRLRRFAGGLARGRLARPAADSAFTMPAVPVLLYNAASVSGSCLTLGAVSNTGGHGTTTTGTSQPIAKLPQTET